MAATRVGLHEERVRVTCHLPVNDFNEELAARRVIEYLKTLRTKPISVRGFTTSRVFHKFVPLSPATLTRSVSEGSGNIPRLRFGLVSENNRLDL